MSEGTAGNARAAGRGGARRHDLDALRAFAMLLGIGLHASMSLNGLPWVVMDRQPSNLLLVLVLGIHGFRMPLFFLVSGYFSAMLADRRGPVELLKNRAARILVPFLLGLVTIVPLTDWVMGRARQDSALHPEGDPIFAAIIAGDRERVERLLESGDSARAATLNLQIHPLEFAVLWEDEPIARLLLERGADPMEPDRMGNNALCAACFMGNLPLLEKMCQQGADAFSATRSGDFPRDFALKDRRQTRALLKIFRGKDPEDLDRILAGRAEVVAWLDSRGTTPSSRKPESAESWAADGYRVLVGGVTLRVPWSREPWNLFLDGLFGHLWFLWYLWWMACGYATWRLVLAKLGRGTGRPAPVAVAFTLAVCLSLICQYLMGIIQPEDGAQAFFGPDTSVGLLPLPHVFAYYLVFFLFGAWWRRAEEGTDWRLGRQWAYCLGCALLMVFPMGLATIGWSRVNPPLQVAFTWMMVIGLTGLFRAVVRGEDSRIRYLMESAYWLYLAHLPLIIYLQLPLARPAWPALVKFVVLLAVAMPILLASYQWLVRYTVIGRILNGKNPARA